MGSVLRAFGLAAAVMIALPPDRLRAEASALASAQTVDTVVVVNRNVFDRDDNAPGLVARVANALHITTRASVIRRSLLVNAGDSYDSARVAESERALRALSVFREVALDTVRLVDGDLALRVTTADGWSTKPQAAYSSSGGDETWEVGVVEENILGTASQLGLSYRRTPDRRELELQYFSPHLLARHTPVLVRYRDYSDGREAIWRVGVPFAQTASRRALATDGEAARERVLVFRDGLLAQTPERRALRFGVVVGTATRATSRDYLRLWAAAHWRREDFAPETTTAFPRSSFGAVGAGVELGHVRYGVLHQFNAYARREDVELSQVLRVGVWAAPRAWGYPAARAGLGAELGGQLSSVWRGGFAVLRGQANGIYSHAAAALDSGRVRGSLTVASQNLPRQTWILFVEGGIARRPAPGTEFDLWLERRGPRLFPAHAFSGTRMFWGTLENRILVAEELWGLVGVGLAPFFDWGGAWYADQRRRIGGDVGLALRMGPTRSGRGEAGEFSVGYRFGGRVAGGRDGRGWAVGVRKGFPF